MNMQSDIENCIIHLNGYPGTGKLTVAKEICRQAGFRLIDNHATANLVFNMVRKDGKTSIPREAWDVIGQIRNIVTDSLPKLAPKSLSFVFTNCLAHGDQSDIDVIASVEKATLARGGIFVPVVLTCDMEENRRRVVRPDRETNMKMTDADGLKDLYNDFDLLRYDHDNFFELDITSVTPANAAKAIIAHARKVAP